MGLSVMQVYQQVHALLPDVHYSALAKVLSLKTPGKRKQERLPGDISLRMPTFHACQASMLDWLERIAALEMW